MTVLNLTESELLSAQKLIQIAFREDLGDSQDITTNALVPANSTGQIQIATRASGVACGIAVAELAFNAFDEQVKFTAKLNDGDHVEAGAVIAEAVGPLRSLLTVERTALNFLTMLSGIATLTSQYVRAAGHPEVQILDTRKTHPGLRALQKFAVRCGGGFNHRMGLFDAVLVKDNHLAWLQQSSDTPLCDAVIAVRNTVDVSTIIEIEVDNLEQLRQVLPAVPDIVLLDNMSDSQLRQAVESRNKIAPNVLLEASGGITLETIPEVAATGIDRISVGALTHSAVAIDIGFDWIEAT